MESAALFRTFATWLTVWAAFETGSLVAFAQQPLNSPKKTKDLQFFESKVRPLLIAKCYGCHSLESQLAEGGLRLDSREATLRGGTGGPAIQPGDPEASMLIRAVEYRDENLQMPPADSGGKLSDSEIKILKQWVRMGAPDPRDEPAHLSAGESPAQVSDWWAYQPLAAGELPASDGWAWNEIDRWIEREHRQSGISPHQDADSSTVVRRLYFDLIGLPPRLEDINEFKELEQNKSRREAIEVVVDQLLESDDFGPHWGRHWLDVARYGESSGRDINVPYNHAWRYRDWVIDAFQSNMPFDRFLTAQIAGDQLTSTDAIERASLWVATGFLAVGSKNLNENNPLQFSLDQADEQIDTVFQAMMGTTFACARCHDHKFDPISQREYTAVAGVFLSTDTRFGASSGNNARNEAPGIELPAHPSIPVVRLPWSDEILAEKRDQLEDLTEKRRTLDEELKAQRKAIASGKGVDRNKQQELRKVGNQVRELEFQLGYVDSQGMPRPLAMGVIDRPALSEPDASGGKRERNAKGKQKPENAPARRPSFVAIGDSPFFARGEVGMPGEKIPRMVPGFVGRGGSWTIDSRTSGRLQLAQWIVSPENPLTPRVAANRAWVWLMGRGIVETVDNFGSTGSLPSHPELLDYLAIELQDGGWNFKEIIRKIATSRTYQLSSIAGPELSDAERSFDLDPENRLYWRGKRRRLQAEEIRDSMLMIADRLDRSRPLATTLAKKCGNKIDLGLGRRRAKGEVVTDDICRSVYLSLPRSASPEVLELFDLPDGSFVQGMRESTNVPSQSLFLLNSPQVAGHASAVVRIITQRIPGRGAQHFEERATLLWQLLLARPPETEELEWARQLLTSADNSEAGWVSLVRGLFATAEYRYLD